MNESTAGRVADYVEHLPERSFIAVNGVDGPRSAVESAFSRLAASGAIVRVRKGLYWKGASTPLGMSPPTVEETAVAVGGRGAGPAGVAAAHWLGLTSQVPSTYLVAVPARTPQPWRSVRFTRRPAERLLRDMTPTEVAIIEVLRAGPGVVEDDWRRLGDVVTERIAEGSARADVIAAAVASEPHRAARARWAALGVHTSELAASA